MALLIFIFLLCFPIFIFYIFFPKNASSEFGFKSYPIVGSFPSLVINRHRFLDWTVETLSRCPTQTAIFRLPGKKQLIMTANPSNVEYMLKTKFESFPKGEQFTSVLEDFLGHGIFNSDGEMWWKQRKTASYEFSTKSLRDFVMSNVTVEINTRLVPVLVEAETTGKLIDLQDILERFAFDNICKLAFNVDSACLGDDGAAGINFMRAFETAATIISQRFRSVASCSWKIKKKLNIGSERVLRESIATVHKFADEIVRKRIDQGRSSDHKEDLLSRFISKEEMNSPEILRDIVISFILAGRDTTSSALSWFFWLLSMHPEVEDKILQELNSIRARTGKRIGEVYGFEHLKLMNYLHAAITESLRLYPPVPVDIKSCSEDNVLPDGTFVGKGWALTYNAFAMGRMESIWGKDCDRFDPERWIDETSGGFRGENPYKFPAFHAGPRMCVGKEMAYIQMKSIVAAVLERFVVEVPGQERPEILLSMTLRIRGGLFARVHERS
ncbi:Cytochrome P450 [Arabidopsis thaliana x Arabidopsis arenosa]|uniref:Cytochrome P450 n=1 Tax=Arabidopsis thaliana x Arabidopsis arenosa TaxID=1240361 RepID=A0A8T2C691_9BRAS|nr:Cytochrome P450 [Arabidopsis thaliana x Arabidopsis arenosa]